MKNNRRGVVFAVVAMVAVLVLGFVGYNALANARTESAGSTDASTTSLGDKNADEDSAEAPAKSEDQGSTQDTAEDIAQSDTDSDVPMLADYDATVYTAGNEAVTLTQIADGKPLVMNFWATWCPYCIQEMPDYQQLYEEYGDRVSFAFIDAADGKRETVDAAESWLFEHDMYNLPAYYDLDMQASSTYGAWALPTTVVVSADGQILGVSSGRIDPGQMRSTLDSLV